MNIIGIDFGHGETTASYVEVLPDGTYAEPKGLVLKSGGIRIVRSFFCKVSSNNANDETIILDPGDGWICNHVKKMIAGQEIVEFYSCFKVPIGTDEFLEQRFGEFIRSIYKAIVELNGINTQIGLTVDEHNNPVNFLLYAACPSGWSDEQRTIFADFLRQNGVQCCKVFKESDAAWVSYMPRAIDGLERPKTLVIDYGSSTIDMTWSEEVQRNICNENTLGASRIENDIFNYLVENDDFAKSEFSQVLDILHGDTYFAKEIIKLGIRKEKENFYNSVLSCKPCELEECVLQPCMLTNIFGRSAGLSSFGNELYFCQVNDILSHYMTEVQSYFIEFRDSHMNTNGHYDIPNKIILTGGASRMSFVAPMIKRVFGVDPTIDKSKASESISEGVALAGTKEYILTMLPTMSDPENTDDLSIHELLENIKRKYSDIEGIKTIIKESIEDNLRKQAKELLDSTFLRWQEGEILMDRSKKLDKLITKIVDEQIKEHPEEKEHIWDWVYTGLYYSLQDGVPSLHSLYCGIKEQIDRIKDNRKFRKIVSENLISRYNDEISDVVVPILFDYVKVFAPQTTKKYITKLVNLNVSYIDFDLKVNKNSFEKFLTAMLRTTFNLIQQNDFSGCFRHTLNKSRNPDYRNGYFSDIRNDFENFASELHPDIHQLDDYAETISCSIVDKITELQDYCTKLQTYI